MHVKRVRARTRRAFYIISIEIWAGYACAMQNYPFSSAYGGEKGDGARLQKMVPPTPDPVLFL